MAQADAASIRKATIEKRASAGYRVSAAAVGASYSLSVYLTGSAGSSEDLPVVVEVEDVGAPNLQADILKMIAVNLIDLNALDQRVGLAVEDVNGQADAIDNNTGGTAATTSLVLALQDRVVGIETTGDTNAGALDAIQAACRNPKATVFYPACEDMFDDIYGRFENLGGQVAQLDDFASEVAGANRGLVEEQGVFLSAANNSGGFGIGTEAEAMYFDASK